MLLNSDILIGDMSDVNYEFLVFNRPIILLANDWVRQEFPDIGIKCNLNNLLEAIHQSIQNPNEYETNRKIQDIPNTLKIIDNFGELSIRTPSNIAVRAQFPIQYDEQGNFQVVYPEVDFNDF